jgi:Holliday junction DNA helicase RuvA
VVLDVGGVGYEARIPLSTYLSLPEEGATVRLCVHTHVREDAIRLYGFLAEEERLAFSTLLDINGVGPRLALAILSGLPVARLAAAIRDGDVASLRGVPGVGTRTAERILVELKGKLHRLEPPAAAPRDDDPGREAASALENLGYPRGQAERAVRDARERLPEVPALEDLIREALRVAAR